MDSHYVNSGINAYEHECFDSIQMNTHYIYLVRVDIYG